MFEEKKDFAGAIEEFPNIAEWPDNEKLAFEKEIVGFYVTGHPLEEYEDILRLYTTDTCRTLEKYLNKEDVPKKWGKKNEEPNVRIGGLITAVRTIITRKGDKMAFLKLENLEGDVEVVVFPESFDKYREFLTVDAPVFVIGKASANKQGDAIQVTVNKIISLKNVEAMMAKKVKISFATELMFEDNIYKLKSLIEKHHGDCPLALAVITPNDSVISIDTASSFAVNPTRKFKDEVEELVGRDAVVLDF